MNSFALASFMARDSNIKKEARRVTTKSWVRQYYGLYLKDYADRMTSQDVDVRAIVRNMLWSAYGLGIADQMLEHLDDSDIDAALECLEVSK